VLATIKHERGISNAHIERIVHGKLSHRKMVIPGRLVRNDDMSLGVLQYPIGIFGLIVCLRVISS
jgi:hypothetical protein